MKNIARSFELSERARTVLSGIVDVYTASGQPVGSQALVEQQRMDLSAASVRNVMQDLEKQGLITHPHTSAGRMPTEDGYRYYATELVHIDEVDANIKKQLSAQIQPGKSLQQTITDVSNTLGQLTGCASLVTAPKHNEDPLENIEFIRLSGDRVLVVMVTTNGTIENRVIHVPAHVDLAEINKASSELKKVIAGQSLEDARGQLIGMLAEQKGRVNAMIDEMMTAAHHWGEPVVSDGAMVVSGSTNLFMYPEIVREKLQSMIHMFEEKRLLMALMEEVRAGEGVKIYIGKDSPVSAAADAAIIATSFGNLGKNFRGTLGVIGPMRLNYRQTINTVNYTGQLLSQAIQQTK